MNESPEVKGRSPLPCREPATVFMTPPRCSGFSVSGPPHGFSTAKGKLKFIFNCIVCWYVTVRVKNETMNP